MFFGCSVAGVVKEMSVVGLCRGESCPETINCCGLRLAFALVDLRSSSDGDDESGRDICLFALMIIAVFLHSIFFLGQRACLFRLSESH